MAVLSYKQKRKPRQIIEQIPFNRGMFFSEQTQDPSFAKLLINYEIIDKGKALRTRSGVAAEETGFEIGDSRGADWEPSRASVSHTANLMSFKKGQGSTVLDTVIGLGTPERDLFVATTNQKENLKLQKVLWTNLNGLTFQYNDKERIYSGKTGWAFVQDELGNKCFPTLDTLKGVSAVEIEEQELRPVSAMLEGYLYLLGMENLPEQKENEGVYSWEDPVFKLVRLEGTQNETPSGLDASFEVVEMEPHQPRVAETYAVGFNMLLENPFVLENKTGATHDILGVLGYKPKGDDDIDQPVFSPNPGEEVRYRVYLQYNNSKTYQIKWDQQPIDTTDPKVWEALSDWEELSDLSNTKIIFKDFATVGISRLRVQLREKDVEETTLSLPITIVPGVEKVQDFKEVVYDLTTAKGMFEYNNMLGLYGVEGFEHGIFFSDVGNPGYFPYPYNIDWVDSPILNVVNYLDSILIITTNAIYIVSGQGLIRNHTRKKILSNLNIKPVDALNVKTVKEQIFFKSDGKYYVLKPNLYTSDATDLKTFEISSPIQSFLDNFDTCAEDVLRRMYGHEYMDEED